MLSYVIGTLALLISGTATAATVTVPMRLLDKFPVVTANIDGVNVPLAFDLGSEAALTLSPSVIERVKAIPTDESHRTKDAMGNVIRSGTFTLPRLEIGGVVFTNVIGHPDAHDAAYQAVHAGQQGTFGPALLKDYQMVLDYPRRQITLIGPNSSGEYLAKCNGVAVPFLPSWHGDPVTAATTDFGDLTAVWDTGAPVSILRRAGAHKVSDSVVDESSTTKRLILGGSDFGPLALTVADYAEPAGSDMFIGANFFESHVVCVDFPGKRFMISK